MRARGHRNIRNKSTDITTGNAEKQRGDKEDKEKQIRITRDKETRENPELRRFSSVPSVKPPCPLW